MNILKFVHWTIKLVHWSLCLACSVLVVQYALTGDLAALASAFIVFPVVVLTLWMDREHAK